MCFMLGMNVCFMLGMTVCVCACVLYARNDFPLFTQVGLHVLYSSPEPCAGPSLGACALCVWLWVGVGRDPPDVCFGPTSFLFLSSSPPFT